MNFINSPTRAIAPRLPCVSPYCKLCDSHSNVQKVTIKENLEMPKDRPVLTWINELPEGLLPHLAYAVTPPRI